MCESRRMSSLLWRISLQTLEWRFAVEELPLEPTVDGRNTSSRLLSFRPSVRAPVALASHSAAARCAAFMPPPSPRERGEARLPRMFVTWIGIFVREERERARRRSCPPPSRVVPSRWMGAMDVGSVERNMSGDDVELEIYIEGNGIDD